MATDPARVRKVVTEFLVRAEKNVDGLTDDTDLWGGGLELDSLEAAEMSAILEDEFGTDPFTASDEMPGAIRDILAFYEATPAS